MLASSLSLDIEFRNKEQELFFWSKARNNCFSGGFGNGKSYIGCLRAAVMLLTFPGYRMVIARELLKDLKETTQKTFFKIVPPTLIKHHSEQSQRTTLINGSTILWMHLDAFDEQSMRGLEINSALLDQAEELDEGIYLVLDSRIGRWDQATVPQEFLDANPYWPKDDFGRPVVPNYIDILCNPDTTFHWIYRRYHPDSIERIPDHYYIEAATDERLNDPKTIEQMKMRDPEWVQKYFFGKWGFSGAQIHTLMPESFIEYDPKFIETLQREAALYRILDHGDAEPTCCLWCAAYKGSYIFYREYYSAREVISNHRKNIEALSGSEYYCGNYADPSIFNKASQRDGGFWSVADEYLTSDIDAPSIAWVKADNNEMATRNRINELLRLSYKNKNPYNGNTPAPTIYFIRRSQEYPLGINNAVAQLTAQRRVLIGSDNGKSIYSDDREKAVADHAYDPIRYFIAMHGGSPSEKQRSMPKRSFAFFNYLANRKVVPSPLGRRIS